jgi:hypothetical protein
MEITDSLNIVVTDSSCSFVCPVCMNDITDEEQCITECNHNFCKGCIHMWFDRGNFTCPSCRGEINYYINNLEKNNIVKVNISNRSNPVNVDNANNEVVGILLNRIRFYNFLLSINFFYMIYSLYDGIKMNDQMDNYNSLYHNCSDELEEIKKQDGMTTSVILYLHREYINCEFPTYFLNQCIHYFDNSIQSY